MTTFLTRAEAADRLGVAVETVTVLIKNGALGAVNISTGAVPRYRITEQALQAFIKARTTN